MGDAKRIKTKSGNIPKRKQRRHKNGTQKTRTANQN